jgi:hypothetical protein
LQGEPKGLKRKNGRYVISQVIMSPAAKG